MEDINRCLRIMFRSIYKSIGLECRSYSNFVCSYYYAYQPFICVRSAGPFFLSYDGKCVILNSFLVKTITIDKTQSMLQLNTPYYTHNEVNKNGTIEYLRLDDNHAVTVRDADWAATRFDISDPTLEDQIKIEIVNQITKSGIHKIPIKSKVQLPDNSVKWKNFIEIEDSYKESHAGFDLKRLTVFPNVTYKLTNDRYWVPRFLSKLYHWFSGSLSNDCMIHSIRRHTGCDLETAENILRDSLILNELSNDYDSLESHTAIIVDNYK